MTNIVENFDKLRGEVEGQLAYSPFGEKELTVLPVSKGRTVAEIRVLANHLQRIGKKVVFGENYYDEMLEKSLQLQDASIDWHFLGRLQSRKIQEIVKVASVLHGVERIKELQKIAECLKSVGVRKFKGFFLQMNISNEPSKGGFDPACLKEVSEAIADLDLGSYLFGLMGIAKDLSLAANGEVETQFESLRQLRNKYFPGTQLSMGMSDDFNLAILHDTDIIRVGTRIFGPRG